MYWNASGSDSAPSLISTLWNIGILLYKQATRNGECALESGIEVDPGINVAPSPLHHKFNTFSNQSRDSFSIFFASKFSKINKHGSYTSIPDSRVHKPTTLLNPFPVLTTGISLCSNSHREIPVMKTGFSLCGKLHRENPVLALYWPCTGLQWSDII